jgi:preprotein translocase subunit YajC
MDITVATQLIGSLGFPIVACIALFYMMEKNSARHQEESKLWTEALNNNTKAVTDLISYLKGDKDEQ